MIGKIKALGLAFFAIVAFGAFAASAAQAEVGEVHIDAAEKAIVTGEILNPAEPHKLSAGGVEFKCEEANLEGTVEGGSPQITTKHLTVTATYAKCKDSLGGTVDVQMNGCKYTLRGTATLTAQAQVVGCTEGKKIDIHDTTFGCTITIGEQAELPHVVFENTNPGAGKADETQTKDVDANATVTGIVFQSDNTNFPCPSSGINATFQGKTTVRAFEDTATQQQLTENEHQFTRHLCGTQVGLFGT